MCPATPCFSLYLLLATNNLLGLKMDGNGSTWDKRKRAPCLVGVNVGRDGAVVPGAPVF